VRLPGTLCTKNNAIIFQTQKTTIMNIKERIGAPLPKFFKKLRNIAITVTAIGGTLLTVPVALPALLLKAAGYLVVAGTVASAVSQVTVKTEEDKNEKDGQ
jgi:hypothetical protein